MEIKTLKEIIDKFPDGMIELYNESPYAEKCINYLRQKDDPYYLLFRVLNTNNNLMKRIEEISDLMGTIPNILINNN